MSVMAQYILRLLYADPLLENGLTCAKMVLIIKLIELDLHQTETVLEFRWLILKLKRRKYIYFCFSLFISKVNQDELSYLSFKVKT